LTLDLVILHTVMHHSSTSTYVPNFMKIEDTFCGRTDGWTDEHMDGRMYGRRTFETGFIRPTRRSWPNKHIAKKANEYPDSRVEFIYAACPLFGPEMQLVTFIKIAIFVINFRKKDDNFTRQHTCQQIIDRSWKQQRPIL